MSGGVSGARSRRPATTPAGAFPAAEMAIKRSAASNRTGVRLIDELKVDFARPPGYRDVFDVVRAFDAGEAMPSDALGRVVDALRVFLVADDDADAQLRAFGKRARILGKQGRREPTASEAERREAMVADYLTRERALIAEGVNARTAGAQAKRETCAKWHVAMRTLQGNIKEFSAGAELHVRALAWASAVKTRADKS